MSAKNRSTPNCQVTLRRVTDDDLPVFFEHQSDPDGYRMAAFPPRERDAFMEHWAKIRSDATVIEMAIDCDGHVAGNIVSWVQDGKRLVGYWIGRQHWGKGVATKALVEYLCAVQDRPLYAHVAKSNLASIRVLEKCGFIVDDEESVRLRDANDGVAEVVMKLTLPPPGAATLDRMNELNDADREEIEQLALAVYPPNASADWPGLRMQWSQPEWCVRVRDPKRRLVSFVGVYLREAAADGRHALIGGIGNVKTHPDARRQGHGALGMWRAVHFFRQVEGVDFALLVCEPHLLGYYARLGWREFSGRLIVQQHGTPGDFTLSRVMTFAIRSNGPNADVIDLRGPPW